MNLAGIEPAIPAIERPQTQSLDRAANKVGVDYSHKKYYQIRLCFRNGLEPICMWELTNKHCLSSEANT
jgi:hypothetical protein